MDKAVADIVSRVSRMQSHTKRLLITIDGPCASGKTTFAQELSEALQVPVIHTDDFVIPHERKTPERLAIPGGNCDSERLLDEVVKPWKENRPVRYHKYDCMSDRLLPEETLSHSSILIIEGSYCSLPSIRQYADLSLFLNAPWEIRKRRLEQRESKASLKMFYDRWIPLENAYFGAYCLPVDKAGLQIIENNED